MLTPVIEKFTNAAIAEAEKSTFRERLGCIIFDKNKIISRGHNYGSKSRNKLHPRFQNWPGSVHAEVDAILNARRDLRGMKLIVVRINSKGQLRVSKPCMRCMTYLQHVGISRVYYSTNITCIQEEKL